MALTGKGLQDQLDFISCDSRNKLLLIRPLYIRPVRPPSLSMKHLSQPRHRLLRQWRLLPPLHQNVRAPLSETGLTNQLTPLIGTIDVLDT
ncbi:hypothetical protein N9O95_01655 [Alphaproteobacteria bacterium]|nr:hypothetical protein [Alphaproteobacteria bacterium]